jgi:dihydroorotate dehydrogenase electron transfer subunit
VTLHYIKSTSLAGELASARFIFIQILVSEYPGYRFNVILLIVIFTTKAQILDHVLLAPDTWQLRLQCPKIASAAKPGQFVMASVGSSDEIPSPILKRALAVYSADRQFFSLLVRIAGDGTRKICQLAAGNNLNLVGPLGNGFDLERANGKYSIITAGGSGIASVYLLARNLKERGDDVCLVYGGRTAEDLAGLNDFQALKIPIYTATEDGSSGFKGLVTGALEQVLSGLKDEFLNMYTCGPNAMMQAVWGIASDRSIPCQISVEIKMACGFGVCLGCAVKTTNGNRLACTHGPVFEGSEFIWEDFTGNKGAAHE